MTGRRDWGGAVRPVEGAFGQLPDGVVWWADPNVARRPTIFAMDPNVPDHKNFGYNLPHPASTLPNTSSDLDNNPLDGDDVTLQWPEVDLPKGWPDNSDARNRRASYFPDPNEGGIPEEKLTKEQRWRRRRTYWKRHFDMDEEWRRSWKDYRLHSSIHGVRYAAEPQPFLLRR